MSESTLDAAWEWADESLAMYVLCVVRKILLDFVNANGVNGSDPLSPSGHVEGVNTQPTDNDQLMCYE